MKKLLCLLLTLLLIHPALAEDALDAPDAASLLSCADGTVLAVSLDLRVLRRDTAGGWALILPPSRFPPPARPDSYRMRRMRCSCRAKMVHMRCCSCQTRAGKSPCCP